MASRKKSSKKKSSKKRSLQLPATLPGLPPGIYPGTVLDGRWQLVRKLGSGGMGDVWEGVHLATGKTAAIKTMKPLVAQSPSLVGAFFREGVYDQMANTRSKIDRLPSGPGSVDVFDAGTDPSTGAPFLAMEMLNGISLDKAIPQGPLDPADTAQALDDALAALAPMHREGVVHRDLKPANLFVNRAGDVKVIDFGLARNKNEPPEAGFSGTAGFAPPEQTFGFANPSADVYSLGATALSLLSGRYWRSLPTADPNAAVKFAGGEDLLRLYIQRVQDGTIDVNDFDFEGYFPGCPVSPTRAFAPQTPPHIAAVIDKAMQCNPAKRYDDATAMRDDLRRAMLLDKIGLRY